MGTGIVSVALWLDGQKTLSRVLLFICAIAWVTLGALLAVRIGRERDRVRLGARSPAALTGVAGTEVLGTGVLLLGWNWAGIALLVIGLVLWLALLGPVLTHWVVPTIGVSFVLAVATESLTAVCAALASAEDASWLLIVALVLLVLGLVFYVFVLVRFDFAQLAVGRGDHWITGGALAISTLAAARIALAAVSLHSLAVTVGALKVLTVVLWALSLAWLPALVIAEVARPRWGYDIRRWATVFPVGMYAACSGLGGSAAHASVMTSFARIWAWVGLAVWLVVFAAMLGPRRAARPRRGVIARSWWRPTMHPRAARLGYPNAD